MNDEKIFELFQRISDQLRETTDSLRQIISNHETRIVVLEQKKNDDWKTTLLLLLAKAMPILDVSPGILSISEYASVVNSLGRIYTPRLMACAEEKELMKMYHIG